MIRLKYELSVLENFQIKYELEGFSERGQLSP
jgi:hypothetical protein